MAVPIILGKVAKDLFDNSFSISDGQAGILLAGFLTAFITGLVACQWMIKLVKDAKLKYFSYYCFLVGSVAIGHQLYS